MISLDTFALKVFDAAMLSLPSTRIVYLVINHTTTPGMRFGAIPRPGGKWKSLMLVGIFSTFNNKVQAQRIQSSDSD